MIRAVHRASRRDLRALVAIEGVARSNDPPALETPPMTAVHLAVDLGAESGRVIAGRVEGGRVTLEELHRFPNGVHHFADGHGHSLRWDAVRLWDDIQHGLSLAAKAFGGDVASVGVDTWGVDFALFSASRELLGLPVCHRDERFAGACERAFETVAKADIYAATGVQFMDINSLMQLVATRERSPELLAAAERFLMMPDVFHWLLSGREAVEFTNGTTSQLIDATTRTWAGGMIERFGLPAAVFPEVVEPGTDLGPLRPGVAKRCGLSEAVRVVAPATHDTASAVVAVPTKSTGRSDWAYISSGTWSLIGVETASPVLTAEAMAGNLTNEGGVDGTTRLLKNVMGLWLVQGLKASAERAGRPADYADLTEAARAAGPAGGTFDCDDRRLMAPDDMADAIRAVCADAGLPRPETDGQLVRVALESLAAKYAEVLTSLEAATGASVSVMHVVGGGSQSTLLNELTAAACGVPVLAGPVEATALGNVLVQARTAGTVRDLAHAREIVRASTDVERFGAT